MKLDRTNIARKLYSRLSRGVLRDAPARHSMASLIYSQEDLQTSEFLIDVTSDTMKLAWRETLNCGKPGLPDSDFLNVFPGEHYRFISAMMKVMSAQTVVEIGTYTGMGSLAIREGLDGTGKLVTFDVIAWDKLGVPSHFDQSDFQDGRIEQVLGDLADDAFFEANEDVLNAADVIFLDAPKDGIFEYKMLGQLAKLQPKPNKLLIIDDIRFVNMIDFWRRISSPKLDVSTFAHWSGTGLVDISEGISVRT